MLFSVSGALLVNLLWQARGFYLIPNAFAELELICCCFLNGFEDLVEHLLVFAWVVRGTTLKPTQTACKSCHQGLKPMQIQGIAG